MQLNKAKYSKHCLCFTKYSYKHIEQMNALHGVILASATLLLPVSSLDQFEFPHLISHDIKPSGHLGVRKTLNKLRQRYYWPSMRNDVSRL